jgi:hypothetical protein
MAVGERNCRVEGAFRRLLESFGERCAATPTGEEALWRRCAELPGSQFSSTSAVARAYAANEAEGEVAQRTGRPDFLALTAELVQIRRELKAGLCADGLRRLRRRCAFLIHPDRLPETERALGEKFLAEINAAFDRAIQARFGASRR